MPDACSKPIRIDSSEHSWRFDGDDPRVICTGCGEVRDALSGRVLMGPFTPAAADRA